MAQDWWDGARYGGYLVVPMNNAGNQALVQDLVDDRNALWIRITPDDFHNLEPLFQQFNERFMLSIGRATGEVLYLKDVVDALELARAFEVQAPAEAREAAAKVVEAVQTMMDCGAYLEFDI